jgi:cell division protein FtsQ
VLVRSADRFAARARSYRWSRLRRGVVALVVAVVAVVTAWLLLFSGVLAVHGVTVDGAGRFSATDVEAVVQSAVGDPMLTVDTGALEGRIAAIPAVARVDVTRAWPRGLRVVVVERRAVAATRGVEGWRLLDAHGIAFGTVAHRPDDVPRLNVVNPGADDPTTRSALAVVRGLPDRVRRHLVEVSASSADDVRLSLKHGITVVWGGPDHAQRKGAALAALLGRPAAIYDVSTPGLVTTRS